MRKKLAIGALALACVAAFGLGGAALAGAFGEDNGREMSADDAARAGSAGVRAAGGGEILSVDRSDDRGAAWDVEVLRDGQELEVLLDERFRAVRTERERDDSVPSDTRFRDDDERPVSAEQVGRAGEAAVRAAGGGGVESVSRSDDAGEAYEVEVSQRGREIDVALDEEFGVVSSTSDDG